MSWFASLICGSAAGRRGVEARRARRVAGRARDLRDPPWALWPLVAVERCSASAVLAGTPAAGIGRGRALRRVRRRAGRRARARRRAARRAAASVRAGPSRRRRRAGRRCSARARRRSPAAGVGWSPSPALAVARRRRALLRRAPRGALDVADEGPAVGSRTRRSPPGLLLFTAAGCRLCARVKRGAARASTELDEERDAAAWLAARVPGAPYAVARRTRTGSCWPRARSTPPRRCARCCAGAGQASRRSFLERAAARRDARAADTVGGSCAPAKPRPTTSAATSTPPTPARTRPGCRESTAKGYPLRASDGHRVDDLGRPIDRDGRAVDARRRAARGRRRPAAAACPAHEGLHRGRPRPTASHTQIDGAWYRCCNGHVRKLVDCCADHPRRINGDASLTGYCYSGPQGLLRDVLPDQGPVLTRGTARRRAAGRARRRLVAVRAVDGRDAGRRARRGRPVAAPSRAGALAGGAVTFGGLALARGRCSGRRRGRGGRRRRAAASPARSETPPAAGSSRRCAGRFRSPGGGVLPRAARRRALRRAARARLHDLRAVLRHLGARRGCLALGTPATGLLVGLAFGAGRAIPVLVLRHAADGAAAMAERPGCCAGCAPPPPSRCSPRPRARRRPAGRPRRHGRWPANATDPSAAAARSPGMSREGRAGCGAPTDRPSTFRSPPRPRRDAGGLDRRRRITVADAATLTPLRTVPASGADALALSRSHVALAGGDATYAPRLRAASDGRADPASGLGRPVVDGHPGRVRRNQAPRSRSSPRPRDGRLRHCAAPARLAPRAHIVDGPLMYVRSTHRRQRVFLGGRQVFATAPTARRDLGHEKGRHPHHQGYRKGKRPPTYRRPAAGLTVTLTDTAFDGDAAYVTRLRHRGAGRWRTSSASRRSVPPMRRLLPFLLLLILAAPAGASAPLHTEGGAIVDDRGRQVLLRGVNVNQLGDYYQADAAPADPCRSPHDDFARSPRGLQRGPAGHQLVGARARARRVRRGLRRAHPAGGALGRGTASHVVLDMHQDAWGKAIATPPGAACPPGLDAAHRAGTARRPGRRSPTALTTCRRRAARARRPRSAPAFQTSTTTATASRTALVATWGRLAARVRRRAGGRRLRPAQRAEPRPRDRRRQTPGSAAFYGAGDRRRSAPPRRAPGGLPTSCSSSRAWCGRAPATDTLPPPGASATTAIVFSPHLYGGRSR